MPQILDYFLNPLYGMVCLSGQDAEVPWELGLSGQRVLADASAVAVSVAEHESGEQIEVEVYLGSDEMPLVTALRKIYDGSLHLSGPGLRVSSPTGDEVLMHEVDGGAHDITIYDDGYPSSRLVIFVDS